MGNFVDTLVTAIKADSKQGAIIVNAINQALGSIIAVNLFDSLDNVEPYKKTLEAAIKHQFPDDKDLLDVFLKEFRAKLPEGNPLILYKSR